jgi:nucleotidyltransferase substrate binding protein (TIGR01987 family)
MVAMSLNTDHLLRTAATLEQALIAIGKETDADSVMYDLYRNAAIKSFELSLETAGKLARKALKAFGGSPREIDKLTYNDVLRAAGKHGLLELEGVERWLAYRANRNATAHDYGVTFANETMTMLPNYLRDVRVLATSIQKVFDDANH